MGFQAISEILLVKNHMQARIAFFSFWNVILRNLDWHIQVVKLQVTFAPYVSCDFRNLRPFLSPTMLLSPPRTHLIAFISSRLIKVPQLYVGAISLGQKWCQTNVKKIEILLSQWGEVYTYYAPRGPMYIGSYVSQKLSSSIGQLNAFQEFDLCECSNLKELLSSIDPIKFSWNFYEISTGSSRCLHFYPICFPKIVLFSHK
jgi:hypothetical protein